MEVTTTSEEETADFAGKMAAGLSPGTFIALTGDLGAGKTAFTRGLARGLGISRDILSPTFTLLRQYTGGRLPLYHFDVYRLSSEDELEETGFFDAALDDGVTVCEWADLIEDSLPVPRTEIRIEILGEEERRISKREVAQ